MPDAVDAMDPGQYCRTVESYLCRQNDGHLIRIVGPAFELVCGWAEQGIPVRVVCAAIDRTFERYYAKGPRRRPVRIEFCDADVREAFDEWRRAVGVGTANADPGSVETRAPRRPSLSAHIDRVVERLSRVTVPADGVPIPDMVSDLIDELGSLKTKARTARGSARDKLLTRLTEMEHQLTEVIRQAVEPAVYERLQAEAARDLEPYRERMPPDALAQARQAGTDRLLYDYFKLPRIAFE